MFRREITQCFVCCTYSHGGPEDCLLQRGDVSSGEIDHMNVVTNSCSPPHNMRQLDLYVSREQHRTCAVPGRIVVSENVDEGTSPDSDLLDIGHEVVGDALRVLADESRRMGTHRVKVSEDSDAPLRTSLPIS